MRRLPALRPLPGLLLALLLAGLSTACAAETGTAGAGGVASAPATGIAAPQADPGTTQVRRPVDPAVLPAGTTGSGQAEITNPYWRDLRERLARDGYSDPRLDAYLASMGPLTQSPMGRKMRELYRRDFLPRPKPKKKPAVRYYKGVVTEANAARCRSYVADNRKAFHAAEKRYGVPSSVAVSLLFVETRLGSVLADVPENAFHTLASMAQCRSVDDIPDWLSKMPGWEQHADWFATTMPKRADWAYRETRALVAFMLENDLPPERFPSSIYGAVGLCQFMPSNIPVYGVDGNGDGIVDLFQVDDAVMSLSNYLAKHGWKPGVSRQKQHRLLKTYNHSDVYANTILALSDLVSGKKAAAAKKSGSPKKAATARKASATKASGKATKKGAAKKASTTGKASSTKKSGSSQKAKKAQAQK